LSRDTVRIEPVPVDIGTAASASEIRLGGGSRGAVVFVHDRPSRSVDVVAVMNDLAIHGYESIAVAGPRQALPDPDGQVERILAAADHLIASGSRHDSIGLVGIGAGGRSVYITAVRAAFGAAVSISPVDSGVPGAVGEWLRGAGAPAVRTPWLGLFATGEGNALQDAIKQFGVATSHASPVYTQTVAYCLVDLDLFRNESSSMAHAASYDAWQRTIEWLNLQVAPPLTPVARAWQGRHSDATDSFIQREE
jgi:carboxymethylenebutenolidase